MAQSNRLSKAERREMARKEAERIRKAHEAKEKRSRRILIAVVVVVVAFVAVAGFMIFKSARDEATTTALSGFDGATPIGATDRGGIPVGAEGAGAPNDNAPELDLYVDFMCPACGQFEQVNGEDIATAVQNGEVTAVYHPLGFLDNMSNGTNYSTRSASAFATVATESPDKAMDFLTALFAQQPEENSTGLTDEEIAQVAVDAGVPQDVADQIEERTYTDWVGKATEQAGNDDVQATPTVKIDGEIWQGDWSQPGSVISAVKDA